MSDDGEGDNDAAKALDRIEAEVASIRRAFDRCRAIDRRLWRGLLALQRRRAKEDGEASMKPGLNRRPHLRVIKK
jgi:hypothetical protein